MKRRSEDNDAAEAIRPLVREVIKEFLKNAGMPHEKTVAGGAALKKMHDAPGVIASLGRVKSPQELAQIIQAIIDAVPLSSRDAVLKTLGIVQRHEKKTHPR